MLKSIDLEHVGTGSWWTVTRTNTPLKTMNYVY